MAAVNYVLSPFKGNINPGDPTMINIYPQATKYMDKENDRLDISVSNAKGIIYHFLSLAKQYGWECLKFMVGISTGANNIF